ncbi:MAG TPA: DoxX family protein [Methylococcaceae bacterium]|nr:DoxX family protein [Methylococcaceae bacterium]
MHEPDHTPLCARPDGNPMAVCIRRLRTMTSRCGAWERVALRADFLAPLAIRFYLAPVFWMAGSHKIAGFEATVAWFGNPDWGLGLPAPYLLAWLATAAELLGAVLLPLGLAVRWISIPLLATMAVAAMAVHGQNGWLAIAAGDGPFANERTRAAIERLQVAKEILQQHGDYGWLTEYGNLAMLNNGVEFAVTYFVMLLALFFFGGGRYVSLDYWVCRRRSPPVRLR